MCRSRTVNADFRVVHKLVPTGPETSMNCFRSESCFLLCLLLAAGIVFSVGDPLQAGPVQVRIRRNVMMPARDGVRLATDIYLPDGEPSPPGPFPAILIRTPYNKSSVEDTAEYFTRFGYGVAVQDVRGRYSSKGSFYIYIQEGPDGRDAVEWLAARPWCNGDVGTYGGSYLAATQNALAVLRPPHLRTMFVLVGTSNYVEDGAGRGGAFALLHNATYGFRLAYTGKEARTWDAEEPEDTPSGLAVKRAYDRLGDWLMAAPLKSGSPLAWTPSYQKWYSDWRAHPTYDDYWKQNGYNFEEHWSDYPDIPICFVGGWYDIFKRGTLNNFMGLSGRGPYTKLLMGPWTHSTGKTFAGNVDFGRDAEMKMNKEAVRWFDHFLKGTDQGIEKEPPVRYFLMGGGEVARSKGGRLQSGGQWKTADNWPPGGFMEQRFYLHSDGSLRTTVPPQLSGSPVKKTVNATTKNASFPRQGDRETDRLRRFTSSTFQFDPHNPVPTIGGNIDSGKHLVRRGAQNQVSVKGDFAATNELPISARRDVLTFKTAPLEHDVEVTGPIRAELWVSSTAEDTDFTAKLIDVFPSSKDYPDGYAMNLEDGILRMRFHNSREQEQLMKPGEICKATIDLWATANVFRKGHRIRLDVSSSNFPMYDVNPNTGEPLGRHTRLEAALNTVWHGVDRPSFLALPVRAKEKSAH